MKSLVKKVLEKFGYEIRRHVKNDDPIFDIAYSAIAKVARTSSDHHISLFVADKRDTIQSVHKDGRFYEEDMLELISKNFAPGQTFVDIGANVGNHSIFVAAELKPALVISMEPMRYQHSILVINVLLNEVRELIDLHKVAASDQECWVKMVTPYSRNSGRSMITDTDQGEWVKAVYADAVINNRHVDFIKIDVEGYEIKVLSGLRHTIRSCRPKLLVEVADVNICKFNKWMQENGYSSLAQFRHHTENTDILALPDDLA